MILVVPLVAVCVAVRLPRDLETMELSNSIELDPEGSFRLDWDLVDKEVANPEIVLEMKVATSGWFSLRFTSDDLKMGDYFFGAYDQFKPSHSFFLDKHCSSLKNGTGCERPDGPVDDVRNDFKLISLAVDNNSLQILRISRLADTGDVGQDVVIKVKNNPDKNIMIVINKYCQLGSCQPGPIMIGWFWSSAITDQNGELTPIEKLGFQDVVLIPETDF